MGVRRGRAVRALLALCAAAVVFLMAGAERAAAQTGGATAVSIPDANLRARLETWLGKASGETITRDDMATLGEGPNRRLTLTNLGIRDLTGLEYAVNVHALFLSGNQISDLTPLGTLAFLQTLDLVNNQISDITPLARLRHHLQTLKITRNRVTDLTPLAQTLSLRTLEIGYNRISDLGPLVRHVELRNLAAGNNQISDLTPLAGLAGLENLLLRDNMVTNIGPLRTLQSLVKLEFDRNRFLKDLDPLRGLTGLQRISLQLTAVEDISPLVATPGLESGTDRWIDLRNNPQWNAGDAVQSQHASTLQGRGVRVIVSNAAALKRVIRGVTVKPELEQLKVEWEPATGSNAQGYRVFWRSGGEIFSSRVDPPRHAIVTGLETTTYTIPDLTPGREYGVAVGASDPFDPISRSVYGTPLATGPVELVAVVAVEGAEEKLTVSWLRADKADDYKVQWKSGDQDYDEARQARAGGADKTEYIISDLEGGTEYTVRVIATRNLIPAWNQGQGQLNGEFSAEKKATTWAPESSSSENSGNSEDSDPESVSVDVVDVKVDEPDSLTVSWLEVSRATHYLVQWRQSATQEFDPDDSCVLARESATPEFDPDDPECSPAPAPDGHFDHVVVIPGLEAGVEYTVRVTPMIGGRLGDHGEGVATPQRPAVVTIMGRPEGALGTGAVAVTEGEGAELVVMLDRPAQFPITVSWTTRDDTAKAGEDYTAMSDRLKFKRGDVRAKLLARTRQDAHVEPEETFLVRLTNATNATWDPDAASATVTIVDDDTDPARRRALDAVLAGMGRWIAADAVDTIEERFTGRREVEAQTSLGGRTFSLPGTGPQDSARFAPAAAGTRFADDFSHGEEWRIPETEPSLPVLSAESVSGSRFNLPLGEDGAGEPLPGLRVWGRGTAGGFDSKAETGLRVDGDIVGGYVGFDHPVRRDALLGMAIAHGRSDVDYAIDGVTDGAVDMELTSVLPYGHWTPRAGLGVWGLLGAGWGDVGLQDEVGEVETDATMRMAAAGVRRDVAAWRDIDAAVKADAFTARLETDAAEGLPKSAGAARRLRLSLEGSARRAVSPVSSLTPSLEVGGRWDGGDAETGMGVEVGGGLAFEHETLGLAVEARGRALLAHRESLREWGMSLSGRLDPGVAGRGPWMTFAPGWGVEGSRMSQMWDNKGVFRAHDRPGEAPEFQPGRLNMEVGWGLPTLGGRGRLTPWAGLSMAESDMNGYTLGARMETGTRLRLNLENRQSKSGGYRLMLFGSLHL